jgi:hypothetical protein
VKRLHTVVLDQREEGTRKSVQCRVQHLVRLLRTSNIFKNSKVARKEILKNPPKLTCTLMKKMKKCYLKINENRFQSSMTQKLPYLRNTTISTTAADRMTSTLTTLRIRANSAAEFCCLAINLMQTSSTSQPIRSANAQLMMRTFI